MTNHRLQALLKPSSIAILGASQKSGSVGNEVVKNLLRGGFEGEIFGVNPGYDEVEGNTLLPKFSSAPQMRHSTLFLLSMITV